MPLAIICSGELEIGYLAPPVGMNRFVSASVFKQPIGVVTRAVGTFAAVMLVGLAAITWWPPLSLALPDALRERPMTRATSAFSSAFPADGTAQALHRCPPHIVDGLRTVRGLQLVPR